MKSFLRISYLVFIITFLFNANGCKKDSLTEPTQPKAEIRNIKWVDSSSDDHNNNGYTSYRELHVEYRNSIEQAWLFLRVKYKKTISSTYLTYWKIMLESETWESIDFDIGVQIELSNGLYDFEVSVYDDQDNLVSYYGPNDDNHLKAQAFETTQEDYK